MNQEAIQKIENFGEEYRRTFLPQKFQTGQLSSAWWEALLFFFARAYYQGRRDTVSKKVHDVVLGELNQFFEGTNKDTTYEHMKADNWQTLTKHLKLVIGKGHIGKSADIHLTIDTFRYIGSLPSKNIVAFSVEQIKSGKLREHYGQLQHNTSTRGIYSVGPKIAAFYLRDIVSLFELDDFISPQDLVLLQPIDTWVRKIALKIGLIHNADENDEIIREKIVNACKHSGVSSLKFNQGAWFLGYHSFEIILRNIKDIK